MAELFRINMQMVLLVSCFFVPIKPAYWCCCVVRNWPADGCVIVAQNKSAAGCVVAVLFRISLQRDFFHVVQDQFGEECVVYIVYVFVVQDQPADRCFCYVVQDHLGDGHVAVLFRSSLQFLLCCLRSACSFCSVVLDQPVVFALLFRSSLQFLLCCLRSACSFCSVV